MKITATKVKKTRQKLLIIECTDGLLEIALQVHPSKSVFVAASLSTISVSSQTAAYRFPLQVACVLNPC